MIKLLKGMGTMKYYSRGSSFETFLLAILPQQQEQLKQRIAFTDKKIDALVYELYGLSEEEIKIVEGEKN